jgi:hypothetical protein
MMNTTEDCRTSSFALAPRTTFARGGNEAAVELSALSEPTRLQPSGATNEQLHSRRPFIPTDLVQNTAECLGRVAGLLSFRGVSTEWQGAVSDAVGFLNDRCWNRLECNEYFSPVVSDELRARLRLEKQQPSLGAPCCVFGSGSSQWCAIGPVFRCGYSVRPMKRS